jgi:F0F1-type ATP synthase assembly protein I
MSRYASLATQWMVMLLIGVWLGHKLDLITEWRIPLFLILFPLISLTFSLWQLVNELNKPKK